jgi:hypothetical protein
MSHENENFPLALPSTEKPYRTLLFFSAYGKSIAHTTSAVVLLGAISLWWFGYGVIWLPAGVICAAIALVMLNCFAELIDLLVDTMIPK